MSFSEKIKKDITVPNALTLMRIVVVLPFVMSVMYDDYITAVVILVISGITDFLDGIIARKFNQVTELGKMLDPTADKITLVAVMVCVGIKFPEVYPFMIILIAKELIMLIAGAVLLGMKQRPPAAKWYGKIATIVFYLSIIVIIGAKAFFGYENEIMSRVLMYLTAICMFYAVIRYGSIFIQTVKSQKMETNFTDR